MIKMKFLIRNLVFISNFVISYFIASYRVTYLSVCVFLGVCICVCVCACVYFSLRDSPVSRISLDFIKHLLK